MGIGNPLPYSVYGNRYLTFFLEWDSQRENHFENLMVDFLGQFYNDAAHYNIIYIGM